MNVTQFINSKLGDKMWTHSPFSMHREELAKWLDEYAELKASEISSSAVLAEGLPVPRNCKYCGLKVTWEGNDEDCHKNPNR